ncbi:MAG: SPASM domain-containing protein [Planctomycetes bacterium]|nr:SPASM domain-containing protein [Planctomycetota bacterium]
MGCSKIWESPFITVEGKVSQCPMTFYNAKIDYGSLLDSGFDKIWNCNEIKTHRSQMTRKEIRICKACPLMNPWKNPPTSPTSTN